MILELVAGICPALNDQRPCDSHTDMMGVLLGMKDSHMQSAGQFHIFHFIYFIFFPFNNKG